MKRTAVAMAVLVALVGPGPIPGPLLASAAKGRSLAAYRGLGSWVDIYEDAAWKRPKRTARIMAGHGVRTLYLETSNYSRPTAILYPKKTERLIHAAHKRGVKVVAWYLPGFDDLDRDLARSKAAIDFRTAKGQRFDSFALDIEASVVKPPSKRTKRLLTLSRKIRDHACPSYTLGAIIPSPRGIQLNKGYWPGFPYEQLANRYDVFVPMTYYSWRTAGATGAHDYTARNIRIIRKKTGQPTVPIHVIGGIGDGSTGPETRGFVRACREHGVIGCSMYSYTVTGASDWKHLEEVPVNPRQSPALPVKVGNASALGNVPGEDTSHPKEVFYRTGGRKGSWTLEFEAWDVQLGEVEVWVNWKKLAEVAPTVDGTWSEPRSVTIPAKRLKNASRNYIHFVAAGDHPDWSAWGVRNVDLVEPLLL
ncbi:MAG: hypothetical protein ACRDI0_00560 [Actinomycetota bacterium]